MPGNVKATPRLLDEQMRGPAEHVLADLLLCGPASTRNMSDISVKFEPFGIACALTPHTPGVL